MKTKNILLALGVLLVLVFGIAQFPTILPVSPVTEFVDFLKGMRATGPLEVGPVGRNLKTWWNFEDFIGPTYSPTIIFRGIWMPGESGTAARVSDNVGTALRPGILKFTTGTTNAGTACLKWGADSYQHILFGAGTYTIETDIYIETLSDGTENYTLRFGFGDSVTADFVDGAYFEYTDVGGGTPTPNWYKCTASNSTRTKTNTTVAAVAGAWTRLKVVVNAAGTSVEYFINGISVGVVTTNIPTGVGRETMAVFSLIKSAGITARLQYVDWVWVHIDLTTSR
jgi:hypothetical protein